MTDLQLYILVAIPLVGILANTGLFIHLNSTMNARFAQMDARFEHINARFERIDSRFELLMSKVAELCNRVVRVEERLGIKP